MKKELPTLLLPQIKPILKALPFQLAKENNIYEF